jgi:5,6-dimethylbenzimidazole synthase
MSETRRRTTRPDFNEQFCAGLMNLFRWRRDVRRFKRDPVPDTVLERLLEAGSLAPSVGLSEPWRFVIVTDSGRRMEILNCFKTCNADALQGQPDDRVAAYARLKLEGLEDAPAHVAVFADRSTAQGHGLGRLTMPQTVEYSAVMAIHTVWLAARAQGIGMGWVSILEPSRVSAILDVPAEWVFVGYLCIGYPVEELETPVLEREGWERRREARSVILRR